MPWSHAIGSSRHSFPELRVLLGKASSPRAADMRSGITAETREEREAARRCLADVPLAEFLREPVVPYESDEVTRLLLDSHDKPAFGVVGGFTVGRLREWLLEPKTDGVQIRAVAPGLTPEMVAATSKLMANRELLLVASKVRVVTRFRNTQGLPGRMATRVQPLHPTDDPRVIAAAVLDGLAYGCGDAMIGASAAGNGATSLGPTVELFLHLFDEIIMRHGIPTQCCVRAPLVAQLRALEHRVPIDLVYQPLAGTEEANRTLGINLAMLREARQAAQATRRCHPDGQIMYFETGQGTEDAMQSGHGVDQQTLEARAQGVARAFSPFLVGAVLHRDGPMAPGDGKEFIRAGLEDQFCGKVLGLPVVCDFPPPGAGGFQSQSGAQAISRDDVDALLTMLGVAGCHGVLGLMADGGSKAEQEGWSFADSQFLRQALGLRPAPEFEDWLLEMGIFEEVNQPAPKGRQNALLCSPWLRQLAAAHAV